MTKKTIGGFQNAAAVASEPSPTGNSQFINIGDATELQLALLPDLNENNPMFFAVEVLKHKASINGERSTIPCMKQYKDENGLELECPACKLAQTYYQMGEKQKGSNIYRKVEHILNVKVLSDVLPEGSITESQAGKIGQIRLTFQTWNALTAGLTDPDLGDVDFTDLKQALPFVIRKTSQGDFPNYSTSSFGRKPIKMSDKDITECMEAIKDLSEFLPEQPDLNAIEGWTANAQASLDGSSPLKAVAGMSQDAMDSVAATTLEEIRNRKNARESAK